MIERIIIDGDGTGNAGYRVIEVVSENNTIVECRVTRNDGTILFNSKNPAYQTPPKTETNNKTKGNVVQPTPSKTTNEKLDILKKKCTDLRTEEQDENEIKKFFDYYSTRIEAGWKGDRFDINVLWDRWIARTKN